MAGGAVGETRHAAASPALTDRTTKPPAVGRGLSFPSLLLHWLPYLRVVAYTGIHGIE
jgi:hypothetical protein